MQVCHGAADFARSVQQLAQPDDLRAGGRVGGVEGARPEGVLQAAPCAQLLHDDHLQRVAGCNGHAHAWGATYVMTGG